jgi:hypothetical protein
VCSLLGCAAQQIRSRSSAATPRGGSPTRGRYDQETPRAYIVEVVEKNAYTRDFWPKPAFQKEQA